MGSVVLEGNSVGVSEGAGVAVKESVGVAETVAVAAGIVEDAAGGSGVSVDICVPEGDGKLQPRVVKISSIEKTRRRCMGGFCAPF